MSGNQKPQISLPTWRYIDFNAAIPIKKRKYFVLPEAAAAASARLDNDPQVDTRSVLDSSGETHVYQKMIGEGSRINTGKPVPSLSPSVSVGNNAGKPESTGNLVLEKTRVKVEDQPTNLAASEIPSSSDIVGSYTSLGKLPMGAQHHSGVLVNSDKTGLQVEQTVVKTHDIVKEICGNEIFRGECQTQASADAGNVALRLGSINNNNKSPNWVNEEPTALNLSLSKGVCAPHDPDFVPTCTNFGIHNVVNRSNWDLNTTMDAWEDGLDRKTRVKTTGEFLNSNNRGCPDIETSICPGTNVVAKSVSDKQKETIGVKSPPVTLTQFDHHVRSSCSLSLGLSSHPRIEKSPSLLATTSEARSACASSSRPVGNVNSVNLSTVKSEIIEESVQVDPVGLSTNRVNQDVVDRFRQENSFASGSLKSVNLISVKAEPNNFTQSAAFSRKDGPLNHPHRTLMQSDEILDLPTSFTLNQKDKYIPSPSGTGNAVPFDGDNQSSHHVEEKECQAAPLGNTGNNEGRIVQDGEQSTHQIIHASEGVSGVSTLSGGHGDNTEAVDNNSPLSYKAEMSTFDDDPAAELSEGSPSRIKTLGASDSFVERDRLPDFSLGQRKYSRWSDESCSFSRERYHGKTMRSPRLNFMPHKRRFSDDTESNLQERDTKNFESSNYGNTRRGRGGAFTFNSYRGRRPADDEGTPFPHSFTRRNFAYTQRGSTNKEDASEFHGFRDGEKFTRGMQPNSTEPMFTSHSRPYRGRNSFGRGRGRTNFSNNTKRDFAGFRSRSPVRSRDRSAGPSSSFRNRSQEDFSEQTDFSHRRSPSSYRRERISSPDHSGYQREGFVRRHNSPPYSHRQNAGRGRGYERGRGYARGRGYGRDGFSFRKPYDRGVHRNQGNLNNFDPRDRVDYSDDFFEGSIHSERFGVDGSAERRQFGYRHDGSSYFRQSYNNDSCAPTSVEDDSDTVGFRQNTGTENIGEQGSLVETDGKNKNSTENASGRTKNMEEGETSKKTGIWQHDELGGGDGF